MLRGEFLRADGLVIPNNITEAGAAMILNGAFANVASEFWVGLVEAMPDRQLRIEDLEEATLGVNGYARQQIARSSVGWPTVGSTNTQPWIESLWLTWEATGPGFDKPFQRLMLCGLDTELVGDVFALSSALPAAYTVLADMAESQRKFKYRVYLR